MRSESDMLCEFDMSRGVSTKFFHDCAYGRAR